MMGVFVTNFGVTTKSLTSPFGGKLDFGIGIKSPFVQLLVGRKCEDGCSEAAFFLLGPDETVVGSVLTIFGFVVDVSIVVAAVVVDVVGVVVESN